MSCFLPRPLWVHYPKDVTTFSIDDQFLLGEKRGQLVVGWGRAEKKQALVSVAEKNMVLAGPVTLEYLKGVQAKLWAVGLYSGIT